MAHPACEPRSAMTCSHCNGTGWRSHELEGVRRVGRCICWRREVAAAFLRQSRIPAQYAKCSFSNFIQYPNDQLVRVVKKARAFADAFPVTEKGLFIIGPPGIGKTHLGVAVLRHVVETKGVRGLFYDTRTLFSNIRGAYQSSTLRSEAEILREVTRAELLVFDDLGSIRLTDWVEETMNLIVTTRYNDRRPTIFTSNHEDAAETDDLDSLLVRVGFRMHSRLHRMCDFLEFSGPDFGKFDYPPTSESLSAAWKNGPKQRMPKRATARARAQLKRSKEGQLELGWSGGKAGS